MKVETLVGKCNEKNEEEEDDGLQLVRRESKEEAISFNHAPLILINRSLGRRCIAYFSLWKRH